MAAVTARTPGDHIRENLGLLARLEKKTLVWIAARLPAAINSDHLSAAGLAAMGATGLSFAAYPLTPWAAFGVVASLAVNCYWRYRQVGDSVQVDVLSVSLSRSVPAILGRIAMPIASRVARESMQRTLEAVKRFGESLPVERAIGVG